MRHEDIDKTLFLNQKGLGISTCHWNETMLVALDIMTERVQALTEVLPGVALPPKEQLPKRVQKVWECDTVLSKTPGTFVPEEGMKTVVRMFLRALKPALT
jgi:hypothetical protein